MDNPLVSVIIPIYNAAAYIRESIASVVSQTYQKLEVIIIDDGSSDNSVEIAKSIVDDRIKIYQQQNKGVSTARNYGIELAKGKYIQFLDADDLIEETKIEVQIKAALGQSQPPAFICSNWARVSHTSTTKNISIQTLHAPKLDNLPIGFIAGDNFIPLMSGLILRETVVMVGGFDTQMTHIEDVNVLIKIYRENSNFLLLQSNHSLFYYRDVPKSASKQNPAAFYEGIYKNCELIQKLFNIKTDQLLLENYWNIFINATLNKQVYLKKLTETKLSEYKIGDIKDIKFTLFKLITPSIFNFLYRSYAKIIL